MSWLPFRTAHCLLLLLLLLALNVKALPVLPLNETAAPIIPMSDYAGYQFDPSGLLTLEDIRARDDQFRHAGTGHELNFGRIEGAAWLRIDIDSSFRRAQELLLEFQYAYLDEVRVYIVRQHRTETMRAGRKVPVNEWPLAHRKPVFPLMLDPGEQLTVYIRGDSHVAMALNASLLTQQAYSQENSRSLILLAVYFGMLIALGCYNFLLFVGLKQPIFLFYSAFVFTFGFAASSMNGIGPLMLWPDSAGWADRVVPVGYSLAATLGMMFARRFLNMKYLAPGWDRLLQLAIPLWWGGVLLTLTVDVQTAIKVMSVQGLLTTVSLMSAGIAGVRRQVPAARIFVLAWTLLLVGTALLSMRNTGLLPSNFFTVYSMQIGSAAEMLLLSFALAARFSDLKWQKEKAQAELVNTLMEQERVLEQRVRERTSELEEAKSQLERMVTEDSLTGLYNRNGLRHHFAQMMKRAHRQHEAVAVMLIDLDDFKPVNDTYGHEAGDELLRVIARRMRAELRESDGLGRLGGDEFVVLTDDTDSPQHLQVVAERLLGVISEPVEITAGKTVMVHASIGICYSFVEGETLKSLLRSADEAMYRVKHQDKNGIAMADKVTPAIRRQGA